MKHTFLIRLVIVMLLFGNCQEPYLKFNPLAEEDIIEVPAVIEPQQSINDPQKCGLCSSDLESKKTATQIDVIEIPDDLPDNYDLSDDMPPVRSQGYQGSCSAWATTYYLKSYQEKIQYEYDYESYKDVMSPAFVYNQANADTCCCDSGSSISKILEILKTKGVNSWEEFPYSDSQCTNLPNETQLELAIKNKIEDYFSLGIPDTNTNPEYTLINLIKTLIYDQKPIVIGLDWPNLIFKNHDTEIIAYSYSENPIVDCGHAVLIVGYDNEMNAFKFVNSWGTDWGNEGYGWIHFDFFLPIDDNSFKNGLTQAFVAYDVIEETEDIESK
ncbi:C1 family peptidase [Tenacibaculum tangerinum]|uniref:C1 family peptidase n=1 Tax=Tenacibaculum tangerinum TaxID=3038772 RepID=A0ABY8L0F2_9FLAO|nr:C1 family peptidase [Tenacibaculum tangerinum]WGH74952.1 C1 family peptidase [Tenacibaculum tangerinum]